MSFKLLESGKILRVASGFDMSSNTELTLTFTLPDATTTTKLTADGVALGAGVTDPDLGVLAANEYVEYDVEAGFLSQAGIWSVSLTYTNTASTPDDVFIGDCATFTVSAAACS
jgi:hypothetical protein